MRLGFVALLVLGIAAPLSADPKVKMDEDTKKAVHKALEWLAAEQKPNGAWTDGRYHNNTAITAYAVLAFLSQGHLPNQGQFGPEVAKASRFLVTAQREHDGYIVGPSGGNMYCHGMATLALAELWGMAGDEDVRKAVKKATDLIIRCQSLEGGWRYDPHPSGADISVTIMQVMALRAAKNGGLHVPDRTLEKAIEYIERCYEPASGGFRYQPGSRGPGFARTAAGACVLQLSGKYEAKQIPKAIEFMKRNMETREHFWYGHYYASHAMHQVGGKEWEEYYTTMKDKLLKIQEPNGSWSTTKQRLDYASPGPVYQTSIATLILSIPANYLPIFQR